MPLPLKFNRNYFILTILIFVIEVLIALYVHDTIVRPYIGDLLVVVLLYCFVKSFADIPVFATAAWVLVFAYFIETLQYFKIVNILGLQHFALARVIIGTAFEWIDLVAYTAGIALVILVEKIIRGKRI
jgi:Protein of unknown function (DUF2809)